MTEPEAGNHDSTRPSEIRSLWRLAAPVIGVQLGMKAMEVVDTMMIGRVSEQSLAAVALGALYAWSFLIFAYGCLMALDPVLSQARGAEDSDALARGVQRGVVLAFILSLPAMAGFLCAEPLLRWLRQPPEIIPDAATYVATNTAGVFPFLLFIVFRVVLQSQDRLRRLLVVILVANAVNVLLNWCFVFGNLGFPAMGVRGVALATVIGRWLLAGALLVACWRDLGPHLFPIAPGTFRRTAIGRLLRLGLPIGVHYQIELGAFAIVGLLMGWLGATEVAGHQIALSLSSLSFMVPMGISLAASVRVGHAVGRGDAVGMAQAARAALWVGSAVMVVSALAFLFAARQLAAAYTNTESVISVATDLIVLAGIFQIVDGAQVVAEGILRGVGDTKTAMWAKIAGFWVVGLPLGCLLTFAGDGGARGLWWGIVIGLALVAVFLALRARTTLDRSVERIVIDT